MAAIEYGTVAIVPSGEWAADVQYDVGKLVSYNGSSYVAKIKPPVGTLPTDLDYWQVSAQGAGKATAGTLGVVKPDGTSTEVNTNGEISVKLAGQDTPGIVKGSAGIAVGEGGSIDVKTAFKQATNLANIIADEPITQILGKISKSIATTMALDQNALLKNMLTNIDLNNPNKVPSAALVHTLYERTGMSTQLTAGNNLTGAVNQISNNLGGQKGALNLNSFFDFFIGTVNSPTNSPIDGVIYLISIPGNVTGRAYQQVMSVGNAKVTMMYRNSFGGTWRAWESSSGDLDVGTYKVATIFQSNAVNGNYRAFHNFCINKTYNITINTATISGTGTDIKELIRSSSGIKYVLFYGTDPSLAGVAAEINITVK